MSVLPGFTILSLVWRLRAEGARSGLLGFPGPPGRGLGESRWPVYTVGVESSEGVFSDSFHNACLVAAPAVHVTHTECLVVDGR